MRILLYLEVVGFLGHRRAPHLSEGDEEQLTMVQGKPRELRRLGLLAHYLQVRVVCCFETTVVGDVLAQCLVAVYVLTVDLVLVCEKEVWLMENNEEL